jgi:hypothetical protein
MSDVGYITVYTGKDRKERKAEQVEKKKERMEERKTWRGRDWRFGA